jgi:type I restriction enzyme S subunit
MQQYDQYRDSGVDWLGVIPEHWQVTKLKRLVEVNPSKGASDFEKTSDAPATHLPMEKVREDGQVETDDVRPVNELWSGLTYFERNDLLVAKITPCFENGKIALLDDLPTEIGFGSTEFHVLRAREMVNPRFLLHLLRSETFRALGEKVMRGAAGQQRVPTSFVAEFLTPLPPRDEQDAIVDYLDRKTEKMRRFVEKKRGLQDLLDEQREAIINRAVTKGLYPNVEVKSFDNSDWINEVPEHWDKVKLKYVARVQGGVTKGRNLDGETVELPYLRVANVQDGYIDTSDIATIEVKKEEVNRYILKEGDVLLTEGGDFDKLGRGAVWNGEIELCLHQNHIFAVRPDENRIMPSWLGFLTQSAYVRRYFILRSVQSTNLASISASNLKRLPVLVPPLSEQKEILQHLGKEISEVSETVNGIEQEVNLIREYHTALVYDVVTGKIDLHDHIPV